MFKPVLLNTFHTRKRKDGRPGCDNTFFLKATYIFEGSFPDRRRRRCCFLQGAGWLTGSRTNERFIWRGRARLRYCETDIHLGRGHFEICTGASFLSFLKSLMLLTMCRHQRGRGAGQRGSLAPTWNLSLCSSSVDPDVELCVGLEVQDVPVMFVRPPAKTLPTPHVPFTVIPEQPFDRKLQEPHAKSKWPRPSWSPTAPQRWIPLNIDPSRGDGSKTVEVGHIHLDRAGDEIKEGQDMLLKVRRSWALVWFTIFYWNTLLTLQTLPLNAPPPPPPPPPAPIGQLHPIFSSPPSQYISAAINVGSVSSSQTPAHSICHFFCLPSALCLALKELPPLDGSEL